MNQSLIKPNTQYVKLSVDFYRPVGYSLRPIFVEGTHRGEAVQAAFKYLDKVEHKALEFTSNLNVTAWSLTRILDYELDLGYILLDKEGNVLDEQPYPKPKTLNEESVD